MKMKSFGEVNGEIISGLPMAVIEQQRVAILKGTFKGHVLSHETDNSGRLVILEVNVDQSHYILVNLYATNNKQQNNIFFGNIELKLMQIKNKFPDAKIIWGGNFNCVHNDLLDRWPPKEDSMCEIKNVCLRLGLIDIWRYKNPNQISYTWSNKDQSKQSRIDYFLISDALEMYVQSVSIETSILTDHKGIAIYINVYVYK